MKKNKTEQDEAFDILIEYQKGLKTRLTKEEFELIQKHWPLLYKAIGGKEDVTINYPRFKEE